MAEEQRSCTEEVGIQEEIYRQFGESKILPEQYSALGLAYIGDAVYDLIIRTLVLSQGNNKVNIFHKRTSSIVRAESQARLVESIEKELTEEEDKIFHHGRNAKSGSSAKNASIIDYRIATGFEALVGYLYLKNEIKRAVFLIALGLERTGQFCRKYEGLDYEV